MSFWSLSDNTEAEVTTSSDIMADSIIPDNTDVLACIDSCEWKATREGDEDFINITWSVVEGEYKGYKVFHKVRVKNSDSKKRDKAIRMLSAIDTNAGGELRKLGKEPDDLDLSMCLVNKAMGIKVMEWELDGNSGNWVSAVQSTDSFREKQEEENKLDEDDIDF